MDFGLTVESVRFSPHIAITGDDQFLVTRFDAAFVTAANPTT